MTTGRIDTHHHVIPDFYRDTLTTAGISAAGGLPLPAWSTDASLEAMKLMGIATAIVSVSTPGTTFLAGAPEAAALATRLNEFTAALSADQPATFGYFATLPLPDVTASAAEAARALDAGADGVILLANSRGSYLGADGQDELWQTLNDRHAVVFVHPTELPGPSVDGIPSFAADFLLDTVRAAYLLVSNGVVRRYPDIRFILSHAGGFVPYSSHRMAVAISAARSRTIQDVLDDFRTFYFDTALSSSPASLPTLLAFAEPHRVLFGSGFPFAPSQTGKYFADNLDAVETVRIEPVRLQDINRNNAEALFPRLAAALA
jgi:6-methylsalicylate decarboxylase